MTGRIRTGIVAASLLAAAITVVALDPWQASEAEAQDGITAIQTPPPVPGIDYDAATSETAPVGAPVTAAGTPAAPVEAGSATTTANNGGYETSLGGSDIAVISEGGSYEIDGPKRKAKKIPKSAAGAVAP